MRVKAKESMEAVKEHVRAMRRVHMKKMVREGVVVAAIDKIVMWTVIESFTTPLGWQRAISDGCVA